MAIVAINELTLDGIGDAIRDKLNVETTYRPSQMAAAIASIETPKLETVLITENGTFTPSFGKNGFSEVTVEVEGGDLPSAHGVSF